MNGIDLANFFSCIPGAKVVETRSVPISDFAEILKCYQSKVDWAHISRASVKIEKDGKLLDVDSFFSDHSYRCRYLRRCKNSFGDKKADYDLVNQWCFSFLRKDDLSQFSLSFIWDYSYIKGYTRENGMREAFVEGVVIAICDYKVWKTEKFRLYAKDEYVVDKGAALLNDVRSILKDKMLIRLYDKYMPAAELKPLKLVDFNRKYRIFWWKNFFRRLFLWCGGWIFLCLYHLMRWSLIGATDLLGWVKESIKEVKRDIQSKKEWAE